VEQRKQGRGWHEYFTGYRRRVNCESIPRLSAIVVRYFLESDDASSFSLVWRSMGESEIKEGLALHPVADRQCVDLFRHDGSTQPLAFAWYSLPRNGGIGLMLVCPFCDRLRRYLYAWSNDEGGLRRSLWQCRECASLRYRSEGAYIPVRWRGLGGYPRTEPWDPELA
jgi:hypothetical protein